MTKNGLPSVLRCSAATSRSRPNVGPAQRRRRGEQRELHPARRRCPRARPSGPASGWLPSTSSSRNVATATTADRPSDVPRGAPGPGWPRRPSGDLPTEAPSVPARAPRAPAGNSVPDRAPGPQGLPHTQRRCHVGKRSEGTRRRSTVAAPDQQPRPAGQPDVRTRYATRFPGARHPTEEHQPPRPVSASTQNARQRRQLRVTFQQSHLGV